MKRALQVAHLAACLAIVVAASVVVVDHVSAADVPDWTVAPCAWWAGTARPALPPYTVTDRCVADDGSLSWAP